MIQEGVWKWPNEWDSNEFEFIKLRVPHITNGVNDEVKWRDDDSKLVPFHIKHVMELIMVYFIWQERNQRLFQGSKRDNINLTAEISDIVKLKLMNIRVKDSVAARRVANVWDIQFNRPK
ncbi:hypothetical protein Tco_1011929 [Tanacetum coccineum]